MSLQAKIRTMCRLQDELNTVIDGEFWYRNNKNWLRAVWKEASEILDHVGWKWWSRQNFNVDQIHLELIDIWHFALSYKLNVNLNIEFTKNEAYDAVAYYLAEIFHDEEVRFREFCPDEGSRIFTSEELLGATENFINIILTTKSFPADHFFRLGFMYQLDINKVYELYVRKNVLNIFRQKHGYKSGTYRSSWDGREDNEVMTEIAETLDSESTDFADQLMAKLEETYTSTVLV